MQLYSTSAQPQLSKVRILVECALMLAIGTVLMNVKLFEMPNGGTVTAACMVPFILVSFRHGVKWGMATGFVSSLLQMLTGFWAPPAGTLLAYVGMILLDYVLAFSCLGLACIFAKPFGQQHRMAGVMFGTAVVCVLRFLCSFLSGVLIWGSLTTDGIGCVIYSLTYNGSYMLPETIITVAVVALLCRAAPQVFKS